MNTVIGICSLLLGGVALPGADPSLGYSASPWISPPTSNSGYPDLSPTGEPGLTRSPSSTRGQPQGNARGPGGFNRQPTGYGRGAAGSRRQGATTMLQMPGMPTDSSGMTANSNPLAPPTAGPQPQQGGSSGRRAGVIPQAPASPLPRDAPSQPRSRTVDYFRNQALSSSRPSTQAKPFATHRSNPVMSPYMNLFRTDNSLGTLDNYNQYVRPQLQQQNRSRQLNQQIQGLRSTSQRQGSALRQTRQYQGLSAPQYYQNYGGYYPGFNR